MTVARPLTNEHPAYLLHSLPTPQVTIAVEARALRDHRLSRRSAPWPSLLQSPPSALAPEHARGIVHRPEKSGGHVLS
jgi:hypothetical protein